MDWRDVAMALFGICVAAGGWVARTLYSEVRELREHNAKLPETYVRRDDYREDMKYIRDKLDTIVERLPTKD